MSDKPDPNVARLAEVAAAVYPQPMGITLEKSFGDPFVWIPEADHTEALASDDWILIRAKHLNAFREAVINCYAQAHYFLCHSINHPDLPMQDDGTCHAKHCVQAREALGKSMKELYPDAGIPRTSTDPPAQQDDRKS